MTYRISKPTEVHVCVQANIYRFGALRHNSSWLDTITFRDALIHQLCHVPSANCRLTGSEVDADAGGHADRARAHGGANLLDGRWGGGDQHLLEAAR